MGNTEPANTEPVNTKYSNKSLINSILSTGQSSASVDDKIKQTVCRDTTKGLPEPEILTYFMILYKLVA